MASEPARQMHLNLFIQGVGHHEAAWRHPASEPMDMLDIGHYQRLGRQAEAAKFDAVFIADALAMSRHIEFGPFNNFFEPLTLLTAIATATTRIGLIGTASTTYGEPFTVARQFASLDRISGGRAGWNIVTSNNEDAARNFGLASHPRHAERYERAAEFVEVVTALWDSWDEDAVVADREAGRFVARDRIHGIDHDGAHFRVDGPIDMPRPPQGRPVLVQAGSSEDGRELAARFAEAIYTVQYDIDEARRFAADVRSRMARYGRSPDQLAILPGLAPIVGSTAAEASAKQRELNEYIVPEYGLHQLSQALGVDLFACPLDGPLPELPPIEAINAGKSRYAVFVALARDENLTLRQLIDRIAFGRGHGTIAGTPAEIADHMEEWFLSGACDGFNILAPLLPSELSPFVEHVVPELQRRGLFRTEYGASTLREHLGVGEPVRSVAS